MALGGSSRTLAVNYTGSAAGLSKATAVARKQVGSLGTVAEKSGKKSSRALGALKTVASGIGRAIMTATKATAVAIASIAGYALVKGFSRLDKLDQATAKLRGLGLSGKKAADIINGPVTKAVTGTAFGLDEAASTAAGAMASGVTGSAKLAKYLTLTADAASQAGISFNDMGQIMNKVQGQGKLTGDVLNQMNANGLYALPMLAKEFHKPQAAIQKMVSQGKISAAEFQKVLQKNIGGAALKAGDTFDGALANMKTALGKLGAKFLSGVFPQMKGVFGDVTGALKKMAPAAKRAGDWLGAAFAKAYPAVKKFLSGLDFSSFKGFVASLSKGGGGALRGIFKQLPTAAASIKSSLATLKPAISDFAAKLPKIGAAASKVSGAGLKALTSALSFLADHVDTIVKYMPEIVAGFIAWRVASAAAKVVAAASKVFAAGQWLVNAALDANPIGIVVLALAALVGGLIFAYKHSEKFRRIVQAAWTGIKKVVSAVAGWFTGTLWPTMKRVWNAISGSAKAMGSALIKTWNKIRSVTSAVWNGIRSVVTSAINSVRSTVSRVLSAIRSTNSSIWNGIRSTISRAWSSIRSSVSGAIGRVSSTVRSGLGRVVSTVRGLPGRVVGALSGMAGRMAGVGAAMIRGLIRGIGSVAGAVAAKARAVVSGAISAAKNALGIHSPSRVFAGIGEQAGAGMVQGMAGMQGAVEKAGRSMAAAGVPDMSGSGGVPALGRARRVLPPAAPAPVLDERRLAAAMAHALDGLRVDLDNGKIYINGVLADTAGEAAGVF